jgi:hypothetical protein
MLKILVHISIVTLYYGHVPLWTWVLHLATASNDINDIKFRVNSLQARHPTGFFRATRWRLARTDSSNGL